MLRFSRFVLSCALALFLVLAGCDSGGSNDDLPLGNMEAEIDGSAWTATNATANEVTAAGNRTLSISGTRIDGGTTTLNVSLTALGGGDISPGTYDLGDDATDNLTGTGAYAAGVGPQNTFNIPSGDTPSGTLTIDEISDESVRGTFSFTATNGTTGETVEVTNGSFNVEYGPAVGF